MITLEDYKNLLDLFKNLKEENKMPSSLELFAEKLAVIYEELTYRNEVDAKLKEIREKLNALDKKEA